MTFGSIDPLKVATGSFDAERLLRDLRDATPGGDELFNAVRAIVDDDRLRGWCRHIQKELERGK